MLPLSQIHDGIIDMLNLGIYAYTDRGFSPTNPKSHYFRMQFNFGLPLEGYSDFQDRRPQQEAILGKYIETFLPKLESYRFRSKELKIIYGGTKIHCNKFCR